LRIARNLLLTLLAVLLAAVLLPYLLAPFYRTGHPTSALMAWRSMTGAPVSRQWVDLAMMAAALPRSVVASEDAKFCTHRGVDWGALREVIDDAEDGEVSRGGSTITQQVAKTVLLTNEQTLSRKMKEAILATRLEQALTKKQILELYLNEIWLGHDSYGVGAAASKGEQDGRRFYRSWQYGSGDGAEPRQGGTLGHRL